jgi:predicted HTH transcriptional regulator
MQVFPHLFSKLKEYLLLSFLKLEKIKYPKKTRVGIISAISENNKITREELSIKLGITIKGIDWHIKSMPSTIQSSSVCSK